MPEWRERVPLGKERDLRIKLKEEDKKIIKELYETGKYSYMALAKKFNVSKRLIIFIVNPEKLENNRKRLKERGGWRIYYDKAKNREYIKKHRKRKKLLIKEEEYIPPKNV